MPVHFIEGDPHRGTPTLTAGPKAEAAKGALVLLHGRGASAEGMIRLYEALGAANLTGLAPQAAGHTWYPRSFLAPMEENQPFLDSALRRIEGLIETLEGLGVEHERIALLGFSQGACLASEFLARHPARYAGAMLLTGGFAGPLGTTRRPSGSLEGTPILLTSGDPDPHVPFERVEETADLFRRMNADVALRRYPGRPHLVSEDELAECRRILRAVRGEQR